jgi:hypothetical protein
MKNNHFVRVGMLQVGSNYYLRLQPDEHVFTPVKFIELTNCPAVVVVQDGRKDLIKCNRSDLYIPVR